ncbi:MAG: hypothetical protein JW740_01765 [Candidatus Zambryskibacteria bacterium]|nr:hypothetical protein [Candidatus Zambryskibacteria bacterium]
MSDSYEIEPFFLAYIKWHYGRGLREFWGVTGNFLWFIKNFFSFSLLMRTLFAPWKKLGEHYEGGLKLGAFAETVLVNTLMRAFGFVTKIIVLLIGLTAYILTLIFSFFILFIWIFAPLILLGCLILSVIFFIYFR